MNLFSGFAWPVPRAFASAVAACRFEQGDVLFDDPIAYASDVATWGEVAAKLSYSIQVLDPPRSARGAPSDAGGRRFDANWESAVTFELCDCRAGTRSVERSTQARLFTCLWRGDPAVLEASFPEPPRPATARELHAALEGALPRLRRLAIAARGGLVFAFVVDEASEASLAKERAVVAALDARFRLAAGTSAPDELLPASPAFHPALRIGACVVATSDEDAVRDALRPALYGPTRADAATADDASTTGRFRLERHGLLAPTAAS